VATGEGLWERKKQQTRNALSLAAVRLSVERGFDNVLTEDIAAEAGVSPRTFNNYFSSKAEAIAARHLDRGRRVVAELRSRPADEPLWEAISAAVRAVFVTTSTGRSSDSPQWRAGVAMMVGHPALHGEFLRASATADGEFAEAVAERTGTDPAQMYPQLVARAVGAAILVAIEQWQHADPPAPLEQLLGEALNQLGNGLSRP
jgi:AcrR family transcriptional regulator